MRETAKYDRAALSALLDRQMNVIARRQALNCAMTDRLMQYRSRPGGPWQRMLPGIYLAATGVPATRQRLMAAQLFAGPDSMITGLAALAEHGVRAPLTEIIDLLVPMRCHRRDVSFVRLHRTSRMPASVYPAGPLRYVPPARAVADAVRGMDDLREIRAVVASEIADTLRRGRTLPGIRAVPAAA